MTVNVPVPASVSIVPGQNNVCQGTPVTFTATPVNGGTPVYQWYKNSLPVGANQSTYSYVPSNGDQVYVSMTSSLLCASGSPATSNTVVMAVNAPLPAGVSIAASQNNICQGTSVTYTATPSNGGTPSYQWYKNTLPVGTSQATYSYVPSNGDQVYVVMTSTQSCVTGSPATSNTVTMVVNPILPASVSVSASQNNICQGTQVIFTATPSNGGTPSYQWYKNTLPVGTSQATYTCVPSAGDQVYVVMNSTLACVSGTPATSNTVTMTVNVPVPASVSIVPDQNNVCEGTAVAYTATPVNGGTASYQWYVNGVPAGFNQPVYSYIPANGDQVNVVMTSGLACVSGSPATSNTVNMIVNAALPAGVSIAASQNNICQGTSVTFTATPSNGGTPSYQWYKNALPVGSNQPEYSLVPVDGDQIYVLMTSSLGCVSGNPAASNAISMVVVSLPGNAGQISGKSSVCAGESGVVYSVVPISGAVSYTWSVPAGAAIVSGDNTASITVNFSLGSVSGDVSVSGSNTCGSGNASQPLSVVVNPIPSTPVVTSIGPLFASSASVGNQWYFQGIAIPGATGQSYAASVPGWYWSVVTLNGCSSDTSNHIYLAGVGIEDKSGSTGFTVYPVPNDGLFNITVTVPGEEVFDIVIFNNLGIKIFEMKNVNVQKKFEHAIDLRPLSAGLYPVVLKGSRGVIVRRVLVYK